MAGACQIVPTIVDSRAHLAVVDYVVIALYVCLVLAIGCYFAMKSNQSSMHYFLADRSSIWIVVGFSLFSSNIGTEHLVGLAGSGASRGLAVGVYEWTAAFELMILGWLFVPFYLSSNVFTMPEFLGKRYDQRVRTFYAIISLISSALTKIAPTLFAGSLVLYHAFGWNIWASASALSIFTGIYTAGGGLAAVIYTELLQTTIICLGALTILLIGLVKVGGLQGLYNCPDLVPRDFFQLFKPASDPTFPWTGLLIAHPLTIGLWYWCSDQVIVQRVLSAKSTEHGKGGTVVAGFLKILPMWTMVLPGLIARALFYDQTTKNTNDAYALLVIGMLPRGMHGIMLAAMLSAMMSSLASEFNSVATIFAVDVWLVFRPTTPSDRLVHIGRLATVVLVAGSMMWIPLIGVLSDQLYVYMNKIQSNLAPPIAASFLLGVLWKRGNAQGALVAFSVGTFIGIFRLFLEVLFTFRKPWGIFVIFAEPTDTSPGLNFLHFGLCNMILCCCIIAVVSLLTEPPPSEKITGLTLFSKGQHAHTGDGNHSNVKYSRFENPATDDTELIVPVQGEADEISLDGPGLPQHSKQSSSTPVTMSRPARKSLLSSPSFIGAMVLAVAMFIQFAAVGTWKYSSPAQR